MFCTNCGAENQDTSRACKLCGTPLLAAAGDQAYPGLAKTSAKAIASLVCGILFFFLPTAILAVIFGHLAVSEIRKSAGRLAGHGIAMTGLVLGYLGVAMIPLIVAAILIPHMIRSPVAIHEASAMGSMRTINSAAYRYNSAYANGYPPSLEVMDGAGTGTPSCDHAQLIDVQLAQGLKAGYVFTYVALSAQDRMPPARSLKAPSPGCSQAGAQRYRLTADPIKRGTTGWRSFYTDESGVIRYGINNGATADSPPIN